MVKGGPVQSKGLSRLTLCHVCEGDPFWVQGASDERAGARRRNAINTYLMLFFFVMRNLRLVMDLLAKSERIVRARYTTSSTQTW